MLGKQLFLYRCREGCIHQGMESGLVFPESMSQLCFLIFEKCSSLYSTFCTQRQTSFTSLLFMRPMNRVRSFFLVFWKRDKIQRCFGSAFRFGCTFRLTRLLRFIVLDAIMNTVLHVILFLGNAHNLVTHKAMTAP